MINEHLRYKEPLLIASIIKLIKAIDYRNLSYWQSWGEFNLKEARPISVGFDF